MKTGISAQTRVVLLMVSIGLLALGAGAGQDLSYTSKTQAVGKSPVDEPDPAPSTATAEEPEKKEEGASTAPAKKPDAEKPAEEKPAEEASVESDTLDYRGDKSTWVSTSVTGAFVSGDQSTFRQRAQIPQDFSGGIEEFHTESEVGKDTMLTIDGRGIYDNYDYLLKMNLTRPELGYIDAGYRQFRTWYDNSAGWFPKNGAWYGLYDTQEFAIDRGTIWFESGLTIPDVPEIIFRYERDIRTGRKDSTIWGDSNETGRSPGNVLFGSRGFVPTFWMMDETTDTFSLDIKHKVEDTKFGGGVRYEVYNQEDNRYIWRRPFETGQSRMVTQKEDLESDMFNVRGWQITHLDEDSTFSTAYAFTTMNTDLGGSRIYGATLNPPYLPRFPHRQQRDEGFIDLEGGAKVNDHTATLNYTTIPWEDIKMIVALRIQDEQTHALSSYEETNIGAPPGRVPTLDPLHTIGNEESLNVAESLELRYDGFQDWLLYLRTLWEQTNGDFSGRLIETETGLNDAFWEQDIDRNSQKYEIGANWYPAKEAAVAMQYYFRNRSTYYSFPQDSTVNGPTISDRYPAYLVYQEDDTHDTNLRLTLRPCGAVTLVSRADLQWIKMYSHGGTLSVIESADIENYILSQTATWNATSRLYLQGSVSWSWHRTDTPADTARGAALGEVVDSISSYWYASLMAGYALTQDADLQAEYSFYRSYPFLDNSGQSMPYGLDDEEHTVSVGVLWRICENMRWNLKYGFMKGQSGVYGQHNNFADHLVSSGVDMAF
jgi:hypothetical protein